MRETQIYERDGKMTERQRRDTKERQRGGVREREQDKEEKESNIQGQRVT